MTCVLERSEGKYGVTKGKHRVANPVIIKFERQTDLLETRTHLIKVEAHALVRKLNRNHTGLQDYTA
jgi:hypothetical protein